MSRRSSMSFDVNITSLEDDNNIPGVAQKFSKADVNPSV